MSTGKWFPKKCKKKHKANILYILSPMRLDSGRRSVRNLTFLGMQYSIHSTYTIYRYAAYIPICTQYMRHTLSVGRRTPTPTHHEAAETLSGNLFWFYIDAKNNFCLKMVSYMEIAKQMQMVRWNVYTHTHNSVIVMIQRCEKIKQKVPCKKMQTLVRKILTKMPSSSHRYHIYK